MRLTTKTLTRRFRRTHCAPWLGLLTFIGAGSLAIGADLRGLWTFDNPDVPLEDSSGSDNHLTSAGADPTYNPSGGAEGGGMEFDGQQRLVAPIDINPTVLPELTMGAWVKPATIEPALRKVMGHDNGGWDRTIGLDTRDEGDFRYTSFIGTGRPVVGTPAPENTDDWALLVAVMDQANNEVTVYVDIDVSTTDDALVSVTEAATFGPGWDTMSVGSLRPDNASEGWVGSIDNAFVAEGLLSAEEVTALRDQGVAAFLIPAKTIAITEEGLDGDAATLIDGPFGEDALTYSDRTHQHNGAAFNDDGVLDTAGAHIVPLPSYLVGSSYYRFANNARDNAGYVGNLTSDVECYWYLLIDNRLDGPNGVRKEGNANTEDAILGGTLQWVLDGGWERVNTGISPNGQADYTGLDEGGDGEGPGLGLNQFFGVWVLPAPSTSVTVNSNGIGGSNMLSVVVSQVGPVPPEIDEFAASFDFPDDTTDLGPGTTLSSNDGIASVQGGVLRLTMAEQNSSASAFTFGQRFDGTGGWTLTGRAVVEHTGENTPADGFSINYGAIPGPDDYGSPAEEGYGEGVDHVSYQVDTWKFDDPNEDAGVEIEVSGNKTGAFNHAVGEDANFTPNSRVEFTFLARWDPDDGASFFTRGLKTNANFLNVATDGFEASPDHYFSIIARTGGHNETVLLDDLLLTKGGRSVKVHYDFESGSGETVVNLAAEPGTQDGSLVTTNEAPWQSDVAALSPGGPGYLYFDSANGADATHVDTGLKPSDIGIMNAPYTMMARVRQDSLGDGDNADAMVFGQIGGEVLHNGARGEQLYLGHWGNDIGGGSVSLEEWRHIAWVYDGTDQGALSIYVDGEQVASDTRGGLFKSDTNIIIGSTRLDQNRDFIGCLDDVRIYDVALGAEQIGDIAMALGGTTGGTFLVRNIVATGELGSMDAFKAALGDPEQVAVDVTAATQSINFQDNGNDGFVGGGVAFPAFEGEGGDHNDFGVHATGQIYIAEAGPRTFDAVSDDGNEVYVDGELAAADPGLHGNQDAFGTIDLSAGLHDVEVFFFERGGGASLEVLMAQEVGEFNNRNQATFLPISAALVDKDGDGLDDTFEEATFGSTDARDGTGDFDGDRLNDATEFLLGLSLSNRDSDGDLLWDGAEVIAFGTDPLKADSDGDGLSDRVEIEEIKSDPNDEDSDNDGLTDGDEVAGGPSSILYDFESDPGLEIISNEAASTEIRAEGGNPGGYLSLTDAENSARAAIIFPAVDANIAGFNFKVDARIGGGTDRPADGLSINLVRPNDPLLAEPRGEGYSAAPDAEENLPEEGSTTGLGIGFDAWDSGGGDVIGFSVKVDNVLKAEVPAGTLNGALDDPTSLQTGPNDDGINNLGWAQFEVDLDTNGVLNIFWKGTNVVQNVETGWVPGPGQLVFGARTGGANQAHHFDNLSLTVIPEGALDPNVFNEGGAELLVHYDFNGPTGIDNKGSAGPGEFVGGNLEDFLVPDLGEPAFSTTEMGAFQTFQRNGWDRADATFTVSVDFNAKAEGGPEVIFESGGATVGTSLVYEAGNNLVMRTVGNGGNDIGLVSYTLTEDQIAAGMLGVLASIDVDNGEGLQTLVLYIDGAEVGSTTADLQDDWSGSNAGALGVTASSVAAGGGNTDLPDTADFASGTIDLAAGFAFYSGIFFPEYEPNNYFLSIAGGNAWVDTLNSSDALGINGGNARYTLTARIMAKSVNGDQMVFGQAAGPALHNGIRNGAFHFGHWGNDITVGTAQAGRWYDVAWRYGGGIQTIMVDGEVVGSAGRGGLNNSGNILIGFTVEAGRAFDGLIDEVKIFRGGLSQDAIKGAQGIGEPEAAALLVHYDFEDGITTTVKNGGNRGAPDGHLNAVDVVGAYPWAQTSPSLGGPGVMFFDDAALQDSTYVDTGLTAAEAGINGAVNYTMMAWAKPTRASNGDQMIFGQPDGNALHNGIRDQRMHIGHWGNDLNAGPARVTFNQWQHFAFTYDPEGNQTIYINGVQVAQENHGALNNPDHNLIIGSTRLVDDRDYEGFLDDVRVYVGTLSGEQITQIAGIVDDDGDGLLDSFERAYFGNLAMDGSGDPDDDGITNAQEQDLGLDPNVGDVRFADSDQDGWTKGDEDAFGTSDNNPNRFPQIFDGGGQWEVRIVHAAEQITNIDEAVQVLNGEREAVSDSTTFHEFINFSRDAGGGAGAIGNDAAWPHEGDASDFVMHAMASIEVPATRDYSLNFTSDDGMRYFVDGTMVDEFTGNRGAPGEDSTIVRLRAGRHAVELIMFERGGGDNADFSGAIVSENSLTGLGGPGYQLVPAAPPPEPGGAPILETGAITSAADIDLDGDIIYAVNARGPGGITVNGVTFTHDAETPGLTFVAQNEVLDWAPPVNFGDTADDDALEQIINSIRWSAVDDEPTGLVYDFEAPTGNYKVTLIFGEKCCDRGFDVFIDGTLVGDEFSPRPIQAEAGGDAAAGAYLSYSFTHWGEVLSINLDGSTADPATFADRNATIMGIVIEALGGPVRPEGLIAYWDFNGSGDPMDLLNGTVAALTGGADYGEGPGGDGDGAIDFGASDAGQTLVVDPIILEPIADSDQLTVAFWQNLHTVANSSAFWANSTGSDRSFQAHTPWGNGTVFFDTAGCCDTATQQINAPVETPAGTWQHFAFVKDGSTKKVYVDGVEAFGGENTLPIPGDFQSFNIGSANNGGTSLQGLIDEFSIWSVALSPERIAELAAGGKAYVPPPQSGMLGYWRFDEGAGEAAADSSGNGNDGAIAMADGAWVTDADRGSVYKSGGGSYVDFGTFLPVLDVNTDFTWSFWVNPEETDNNNIVFGNRWGPDGTDFAPREFVKLTPRAFEWHFNAGGENVPGDNTLFEVGVWAHILVVKSGTTLTYYRNGVEVASSEITGGPVNPQPLYLGGQANSAGVAAENFAGLFDEVAVFDRALSADEVADVHDRGLEGIALNADAAAQRGTVKALADSDGDGAPDIAEAIAGTDPNNHLDYLRIGNIYRVEDGIVIDFDGARGVAYEIEFSETMAPETWQVIGSPSALDEGSLMEFFHADDNRDLTREGFYRARVVQDQ